MSLIRRPAAAVLLVLAGMVACARRGNRTRPAIVLISVDTLRADHLPIYGYKGVRTPNIDALRRDSVLFEHAYSHVPLTLPSHTTILTGLLPFENGVRDNAGFKLSPGHPTLAELLRRNGYATGAAVSSYVLRKDRGLDAGFDFYDDNVGNNPRRERAGIATVAALEKWADTVSDRPLFLFLHIYDPHAPYLPAPEFAREYAAHPYDGCIATADAAVGEFLGYLKKRHLYKRAAIVFLSDHGEGLGQHGEAEHGVFLYLEDIHVPLLLKLPGNREAGRAVSNPIGLVDIFPTLARLAGASIPHNDRVAGVPLLATLRGREPAHRAIYSETLYPRFGFGWSDLASLTDSADEYIEAPHPEFYDIVHDPGETKNLAGALSPQFRTLHNELANMKRPLQVPSAATPEEVKNLASLGYVTAGATAPSGPLPDPKDHIAMLQKFKELFAAYYAQKYPEAISAARAVLADDPRVLSAWVMLGDSLVRIGQPDAGLKILDKGLSEAGTTATPEQATQVYDDLAYMLEQAGKEKELQQVVEKALGLGLATEAMKRDLARIYVEQGHPEKAAQLLAAAVSVPSAATLNVQGIALARQGKSEEARAAFEHALALDPRNAQAAANLGTLELSQGNGAEAKEWFAKATEWNPADGGAWLSLGLTQAKSGDMAAAAASWEKALSVDPRQYGALFDLGMLELQRHNLSAARQRLREFLQEAPPSAYGPQRVQAEAALQALRRSPE